MSTTTLFAAVSMTVSTLASAKKSSGVTLPMYRDKSVAEILEMPPQERKTYRRNLNRMIPDRFAGGENHSVVISELLESAWYGPVSVGTPAQNFKVLYDTGSNDLWLPDSSCSLEQCGIPGLPHPRYTSSKSKTFAANGTKFKFQYGIGSVAGFTGKDTVNLAGLTTARYQFGQATQVASGLGPEYDVSPFDGVLGMSWPLPSEVNDQPWFFSWLAQHKGDMDGIEAKYGFLLPDLNGKKGALDLGFANPAHYSGDFNHINVTHKGYWAATMESFAVNGQTFATNQEFTIFDSGTSSIIVPPSIFKTFSAAIGASCGATGCTVPCGSSKLPKTLDFKYGGHVFSIPQETWIAKTLGQCRLTIGTLPGAQGVEAEMWILGDPFLRAFYAVFDVANARVSLAQQASM